MARVSFHFHGYQPGDLVRWIEPDPLKPPRFEERDSPVSHTIRDRKVRGRNWTDAVLHTYGHMERALEDVAGAASVDIEPQTLAWLLEKDPDAYGRVLAGWEKGVAGLAITPPFHPILPHHHRLEREALFEIMIDFYTPLLRRQGERSVGLWFPETAYSEETIVDFQAAARRSSMPDLAQRVFLIVDERQVRHTDAKTAPNRMGVDGGVPVIARDHGLSGEFAFGTSSADALVSMAQSRGPDPVLVASDLESLLANPAQAERFEGFVQGLRGAGLEVGAPASSSAVSTASLVEFSSWSDHDDQVHAGHTSDTRWTGMRRADGLVISRTHRGVPMSQMWKHGFTLATEQIETAVRRIARDLFQDFEVERRRDIVRRLAVAYARHVFREHYRQTGASRADVEFAVSAESILDGKVDVEAAGHFARAYVTMLMGLRSDARFWDNPDTRVTFQNVACLVQSLLDASQVWSRLGEHESAERLARLLRATLLEFSEAHARGGFGALQGVEGWETTEAAWLRSLQSEVPDRSGSDVVRRAALFALGDPVARGPDAAFRPEDVVADTGHIVGELHGEWDNAAWCEHRQRGAP